MTYKKPEVKVYADVPTAGGCGDRSQISCGQMAFQKSGPNCGDRSNISCGQMAFQK